MYCYVKCSIQHQKVAKKKKKKRLVTWSVLGRELVDKKHRINFAQPNSLFLYLICMKLNVLHYVLTVLFKAHTRYNDFLKWNKKKYTETKIKLENDISVMERSIQLKFENGGAPP